MTDQYGGASGVLLGVGPGLYDLTAKGYSHLRLKKALVNVYDGARVDFSNNRTIFLLSGDVNFAHGDNYVNGIDLSLWSVICSATPCGTTSTVTDSSTGST
jgi:hypothetical protein